MHSSNTIRQQVVSDPNNSVSGTDTLRVDTGYTYTGTATSTLGVAGIQVALFADKNCTVLVQQSINGSDWDLSDSYNYYASTSFGITVQAVSSYVRVSVSSASLTTGAFRLRTALCPIVEALPRSLDEDGHLMTSIHGFVDEYGFGVENTPTDEMRVVIPTRLVGAAFDGDGNAGAVDSNFWTGVATSGGTGAQASGQVTLATTAAASKGYFLASKRRARYTSASSNGYRAVISLNNAGVSGNTRKWGAAYSATVTSVGFAAGTGACFQLAGTAFSLQIWGGTIGAVSIANGALNGNLGLSFTPGTTVRTYEIYWTNSKVWFVVGGELLHTYSAATGTWASTMSHHVFADTQNDGTCTTNCTLVMRVGSIRRLGALLTSPQSAYSSSASATTVLKYGPGALHSVVISTAPTNGAVITICDALSNTNPIHSWTVETVANAKFPGVSFDFKGVPFSTGLTLVQATQTSNVTVIYE